jgi:hypothetical protein
MTCPRRTKAIFRRMKVNNSQWPTDIPEKLDRAKRRRSEGLAISTGDAIGSEPDNASGMHGVRLQPRREGCLGVSAKPGGRRSDRETIWAGAAAPPACRLAIDGRYIHDASFIAGEGILVARPA